MDTEAREHLDLLKSNPEGIATGATNRNAIIIVTDEPPDGGIKAYAVVIASFVTNGLIFGFINSYSIIYTELIQRNSKSEVENIEVVVSLVGVLAIACTFLLSALSGPLTALMGIQLTAVIGGAIAAIGMLLSSFMVENVYALCFTYGIMFGVGASFAYTPSLAILGHYFKKYLGIVNGIVCIGSSVFTVILPPLLEYTIKSYGLEGTFRVLSITSICIALCGLIFKPRVNFALKTPRKIESRTKTILKTLCNIELWKITKYRLWALSMPIALFGYFVPYVYIKSFILLNFSDIAVNLPLQCIAMSSAVGRLAFGFLGDRRSIDSIMLQQISFYVIGIVTIILPFVRNFVLLVVICLCMGLFDGGFIALIGPVAYELCGGAYAAQGIGIMLAMASLPLSIGPPITAALYRNYRSYTVAFVLAGISPIIGATLMFAARCSGRNRKQMTDPTSNGHLPLPRIHVEDASSSPLAKQQELNML